MLRSGPAPARRLRRGSPCPPPQRAPARTLAPQWQPPALSGPAPRPARSWPRWLRKERKNRKQNFLAADGHQLHILQMPPSKNKPAAAPPGRLTPGARPGPLPRELPDRPSGRIPHSRASPGAPLPDTPLPATTRSSALKRDPKWPSSLCLPPSVSPDAPTSHSSLCPPPGAYFGRSLLDSALPFPSC